MATTETTKTDYETNPLGFRKTTNLAGNLNCCNCYAFGYPCYNCESDKDKGFEFKIDLMSWNEFVKTANHKVMVDELGKIPESYKEYCNLYSDTQELVEDPCMSDTLDERIRKNDPSYTRENDHEITGDDMDEVPKSYEWTNMTDENKLEYLDRELEEYFGN